METDDLPQKTSPIISQYEAQLHRDSADDPQDSSLSPTTASTQRVSTFHLTATTQVPTHPPTTKFTVVNSPPFTPLLHLVICLLLAPLRATIASTYRVSTFHLTTTTHVSTHLLTTTMTEGKSPVFLIKLLHLVR